MYETKDIRNNWISENNYYKTTLHTNMYNVSKAISERNKKKLLSLITLAWLNWWLSSDRCFSSACSSLGVVSCRRSSPASWRPPLTCPRARRVKREVGLADGGRPCRGRQRAVFRLLPLADSYLNNKKGTFT